MDKIGTQTPTTAITPAVKKKHWMWRLMGPYHQLVQDEEALVRKLVLQQESKRKK